MATTRKAGTRDATNRGAESAGVKGRKKPGKGEPEGGLGRETPEGPCRNALRKKQEKT